MNFFPIIRETFSETMFIWEVCGNAFNNTRNIILTMMYLLDLLLQAKTTKYDGVYSPLSQSESNTEMTPGPSPKKQKLSHASGDAQIDDNKKDRLEDMRTQHFIQLLCMMRRSVHDADDEYTGLGDHMFGCYAVMNKVYITCLVAHTIKKGFASAFTCFEDSADYRAMNAKEHPSLFKQFCFPPLNIFIPEHFKAMLALMKYLVWGRRSLDA